MGSKNPDLVPKKTADEGIRAPARRLLPWLCAVLLAAYCVLGIARIQFDVDITRMLPPDLPEAEGARQFMRHFLKKAEVLLLLEAGTAEQAEAAAAAVARALEAEPELVARVTWQRTDEDAGAWTELAAWALLNQPEADWRALEERLAADRLDATLEEYVETLATSPFLQEGLAGYDPLGLVSPLLERAGDTQGASEFASADGRLRVLYVELREATSNYRLAAERLQRLRSLAGRAAPEAALSLTGEPAFLAEISHSMERDMKLSAATTLLLTTLLVWLVFRRLRLLPLMAFCLLLTFALTLATCGLIAGSLTALTVGFGSILIGLSADYGILVFQARQTSGGDARSAARQARHGVLWSMATTAVVFLALLPLGFPGLSDLGMLVACGVLIGSGVMLLILPRLLDGWIPIEKAVAPWAGDGPVWQWGRRLALLILLGCASALILRGLPRVDASSGSLRPRGSEAYAAAERLEEALGEGRGTLSLLVAADRKEALRERLLAARTALEALKREGKIASFSLPDAFWPDQGRRQAALTGPVRRLLEAEARLRDAVMAAGFTDEAWALAEGVFRHWRGWLPAGAPELPASPSARWVTERLLSLPADGGAALLARAVLTQDTSAAELATLLPKGCHPVGGDLLTRTLDRFLTQGFRGISISFAAITMLLLALAFRAWRPWLMMVLCLSAGFAALLGMMSWLDLRWNAFTLPALLLSLGASNDYFMHLLFRLQKGESAAAARGALAPALTVCAGSSILGFGSLLTASNTGLVSLGLVCSAALALNWLSALFVMPWLWERWGVSGER